MDKYLDVGMSEENKKSYEFDEYNMTTQNCCDLALCKLLIRYMREVCSDEEKIRSVLRKEYSYEIFELALKEMKREEKQKRIVFVK